MSIPGIVRRTASVVITDMPELASLGRKAAASLAGLAPHPDQSGPTPGRNAIVDGLVLLANRLLNGRDGRHLVRDNKTFGESRLAEFQRDAREI